MKPKSNPDPNGGAKIINKALLATHEVDIEMKIPTSSKVIYFSNLEIYNSSSFSIYLYKTKI